MEEVLLACCVLGVFGFGYFRMKHLDRFLEKNRKAIWEESEKKEPTCVMLTDDLTDEEILEEIHLFRRRHEKITLFLCDSPEEEAVGTGEKGTDKLR